LLFGRRILHASRRDAGILMGASLETMAASSSVAEASLATFGMSL
jgi:hypothetical protein